MSNNAIMSSVLPELYALVTGRMEELYSIARTRSTADRVCPFMLFLLKQVYDRNGRGFAHVGPTNG